MVDNVRLADEDFDGKITVTVGIAPMETKIVAIPRSRFMITGLSDENQRAGLTETEDTIALIFASPTRVFNFPATSTSSISEVISPERP